MEMVLCAGFRVCAKGRNRKEYAVPAAACGSHIERIFAECYLHASPSVATCEYIYIYKYNPVFPHFPFLFFSILFCCQ